MMSWRAMSAVSAASKSSSRFFKNPKALSSSWSTRCLSYQACRHYHGTWQPPGQTSPTPGSLKEILQVSEEVVDALATNKPVVALESTIFTHGAIGKDLGLEGIVRQIGGVPAVCGIFNGNPKVGLTKAEVDRMVYEGARKVSRRDLAYLVGLGMTGQNLHGGTTIAGTMILARLAGIRVFGTGGLGGVHRGGENSMDVSADLTELGRTRVAVVSSGCKGFLDIPRTLEFLETQGVLVSTFADGRDGRVDFPAFWARESGVRSPSVAQDERQAASIILAQERLGIESGLLFANPIPEEYAIPRAEMEAAIAQAVREADERGFSGNENTPFILTRLRELTRDRTVPANIALIQANVKCATKVAMELCQLESGKSPTENIPVNRISPNKADESASIADGAFQNLVGSRVDILVAGSVALDLSCDYAGGKALGKLESVSPALHTSNPATISQSVGGVGYNVALAAHRAGEDLRVKLCTMVGDDIAGATILSAVQNSGLDTSCIRRLGREYDSARTAQYVAVNDANKNLMVAMADMAIFTQHSFPEYWTSTLAESMPKWLVVDGNWGEHDIRSWIRAGRQSDARIAFEPVSTAKSARLFPPTKEHAELGVYPSASVDLATPNQYELAAMYEAARQNGYLASAAWFSVIDAFGMRGARDRFVRLTSAAMTDAGIPVQVVHLLPYVPTIVTKLGADGALLTAILGPDDPRLRDPAAAPYILARAADGHPHIGGVYMRLFPAVEQVVDVVSVNGVGDTFLGVLVAGLARGGRVENLVDIAQRGAVLTLRSRESVSENLEVLKRDLTLTAGQG